MKIDKKKMVLGGMLAVLLVGSASVCGAAVIITDNFSNPVGPVTTGGTITPTTSLGGGVWTVTSGTFYTTGGSIVPNEGAQQLGFSQSNSVITLGFGDIADNTSASVAFGLRQWNGAAPTANYRFVATVGDSESGKSYSITMALTPNFYGSTTPGQNTGFGITNPNTNSTVTSGVAGKYIGNTGAAFYNMVISFDPTWGLTVTQNGSLVASLNVLAPGMNKIDYFRLNSTSPSLVWYVDNVSVDATLVPEPSTWALLGLGLVGVLVFGRRKLA